jgi:hypothetical protein
MSSSCQPQQQAIKVEFISKHSSSRQQQLRRCSSTAGTAAVHCFLQAAWLSTVGIFRGALLLLVLVLISHLRLFRGGRMCRMLVLLLVVVLLLLPVAAGLRMNISSCATICCCTG